jgi:NifU-like protein involved in Fe-S cluster formation
MLYSSIENEPELFDKNSPTVGHALVSSEYNEVIEMTLLIEESDHIIENIKFKTFGEKKFESVANFVAMSIIGICAEDLQGINANALAAEYELAEHEFHYATTIERAVLAAIDDYIEKSSNRTLENK